MWRWFGGFLDSHLTVLAVLSKGGRVAAVVLGLQFRGYTTKSREAIGLCQIGLWRRRHAFNGAVLATRIGGVAPLIRRVAAGSRRRGYGIVRSLIALNRIDTVTMSVLRRTIMHGLWGHARSVAGTIVGMMARVTVDEAVGP